MLWKGEYPTDVKKTHAQFFKQSHGVGLEINSLAPMIYVVVILNS